jgi:phosphatidate cytidylyltransferase
MSGQWDDLKPRILSALVMLAIGAGAIWSGGLIFALLAVFVTGAMMWELSRMTAGPGADLSLPLAALAAAVLAANLWLGSPWVLLGLVAPAVLGVALPRRDRAVFFAYALVIMLTGLCLVILRESLGLVPVLWLLAVVIASDVMGYFAGPGFLRADLGPELRPAQNAPGKIPHDIRRDDHGQQPQHRH